MQPRTLLPALMAILSQAVACGGGSKPAPPDSSSATARQPADSVPTSGETVEVKMTGDGSTTARYEPDHLTIAPGTTIRFINVSGAPHNISFWPDSIPAGAAARITAGMQDPVGDLQGRLLTQPQETYELSFAGAPTGEYKGYCLPHLALGMRIWIAVK